MVDQEVLGRRLRAAARANHIGLLKAALDAGADPNFRGTDAGSSTPVGALALHYTARQGSRECTEALIAAGASLSLGEEYQRTALELALKFSNNEKYVEWFVDVYGPAAAQVTNAVALAAENGYVGTLERLLAHGCEAILPGATGYPAFLGAAFKGSVACARLLLDAGAKIDGVDQYRKTALMVAAKHGHVEMMRFLIEAGCDVGYSPDGHSALHHAAGCAGDNADGVELLLSVGADASQRNKRGETAFRTAMRVGRVAIMERLIALGAGEELNQQELHNALVEAAKDGLAPLVGRLCSMGADPDYVDQSGRTLLQHARGKPAVREQILAARSAKLVSDAMPCASLLTARSPSIGVSL